ncbi:MAG TPA: platelet-activating factor acetylhydrolase IB subunit [Gemmataceae bacterium]|nr:platelet-activating factor acetylhydrolase IB subunit [Gemmataceae bacterium]
MRSHRRRIAVLGACLSLAVLVLAAPARAADKKENTAAKATPKVDRHDAFVAIAKKGNIDVVFLGDSITDGWRTSGKDVWQAEIDPLHAANFGIGGDRTQHVLWRIENGELDGYTPKAAVLMIGTNNLGSNTDDEIAEGVKAIVETIHKKQPNTKVLLLGIFPRGQMPTDKSRDRIKNINKTIAKLDDGGKTVKYLDIGDKFLEKDGSLSKDIMPDFLHLSKKGYEIEANAIKPTLSELMK